MILHNKITGKGGKMRELKFRAWDIDCHRFEYFEIGENDDWYGMFRVAANKFGSIIEQYTGLKDKNDKEIYEGDIVKGGWLYGKNWQVVKYQDYGFYPFIITDFDGDSMVRNVDIEVNGNIHENPELLEK